LLPFSTCRKKASSIPSWTDTPQPLQLEHNTADYDKRTCLHKSLLHIGLDMENSEQLDSCPHRL